MSYHLAVIFSFKGIPGAQGPRGTPGSRGQAVSVYSISNKLGKVVSELCKEACQTLGGSFQTYFIFYARQKHLDSKHIAYTE
jgi:hypothetical protein